MKAPATLDEFYRTFPSERRCRDILRRLRWPDGFRCPRCKGREAHRLRARGLWQCAACRYQASLTAGTPFHGTRVPLRTWFLAMFLVARHKRGISALQFQARRGLGQLQDGQVASPQGAFHPRAPPALPPRGRRRGRRDLHRRSSPGTTRARGGQDRRGHRRGAPGEDGGLPAPAPDSQCHEGRAELVRRELDPPREDHGVHRRLGLLQRPDPPRNRPPPPKGRPLFRFVLRRVVRGQPLPYRLLVAEGTA